MEGAHSRFLSYLGTSRLDFLRRCFVKKFGLHVTRYLIHDLRESSIRQYETAWTALLRYVRLEKLSSFEEKTILEFFIWLFEKCKLQANTIASYRSALVKPLAVGFGLRITAERFAEVSKSFFNFRPPPSLVEPQWCLNKVLDFLKTRRFSTNPTLEDITLKTLFLLALATGRRVSELHSFLRRRGFIVFGENYEWVRIYPNPQFLAKNETASFRRDPILLNSFKNPNGEHHSLCPVFALKLYLRATRHVHTQSLFVNPRTLVPCTKARISQLIRRIVKWSQPGVYARAHDLRKFATVQAFFSKMSLSQIRASGFWNSNFTIASRYLPLNIRPSQPCVAMGSVTRRLRDRRH